MFCSRRIREEVDGEWTFGSIGQLPAGDSSARRRSCDDKGSLSGDNDDGGSCS